MAVIEGTEDNDSFDAVLIGTAGSDSLFGRAGNDWLDGQAGSDLLDGGDGPQDEARFDFHPAGVDANLSTGVALDGFGGTDTLVGIEGLIGSNFDDRLVGDDGVNFLRGLQGADTLIGGGGDDFILGEEGDDLISAGAGDDLALFGGAGNDTIDGGAGYDEVEYSDDPAGIALNLARGRATDGHGDSDRLKRIEGVFGSAFDDTISGDDSENFLGGLAGDDRLKGRGGDDLLNGGLGSDTIDGGDGEDRLSFFGFATGVTVDLQNGTATDGAGGEDVLRRIEHVEGTERADTITGNRGANILDGFGGADMIDGGGGSDTIWGGFGDDTIVGGKGGDLIWISFGSDVIDGGKGRDTVGFEARLDDLGLDSLTVRIDLGKGAAAAQGLDDLQTIEGVENVFMLSDADGRLFGDGRGNQIEGGFGDDRIVGRGGRDALAGGAGEDTLSGGAGGDTFVFVGEWGADTITDFDQTKDDVIAIAGEGEADSFGAFKDASEQVGDDVVYDMGDDGVNVITLQDTVLSDLTAAAFDFSLG